jgi:large conductance mechanosensitive channel
MLQDFKAFLARGNVLDLAVGVIIGGAFGKIVSSLTDDLIMPAIGWVTGGVDFSSKFIPLGAIPAGYSGSLTDYAALKKAGVAMLGYGSFLTAIINFVIMAFVIFMIVRAANKAMPPPAAAPAGPSEVDLLTEIRDALKK